MGARAGRGVSIHGEIRARLVGDSVVSALVDGRVYMTLLPAGAVMPAVTFMQVSRRAMGAHDATGASAKRYQFSCWSNDANQTVALAEAVERALRGWRGAMPVSEMDLLDPDTRPGRYYRVLDMNIWAADPLPA